MSKINLNYITSEMNIMQIGLNFEFKCRLKTFSLSILTYFNFPWTKNQKIGYQPNYGKSEKNGPKTICRPIWNTFFRRRIPLALNPSLG
jgi:hypothetical protein